MLKLSEINRTSYWFELAIRQLKLVPHNKYDLLVVKNEEIIDKIEQSGSIYDGKPSHIKGIVESPDGDLEYDGKWSGVNGWHSRLTKNGVPLSEENCPKMWNAVETAWLENGDFVE